MFDINRLKTSRIARNAGWMVTGQGLSLFVQAAYFVLLARLLGSREYGVFAGASALGFIVSPYGDLGSGLVFLRHVSPNHELFPQYWGNILISTFGTGTLLVVLCVVTARWTVPSAPVLVVLLTAVSNCIGLPISTCAGQVFQTFESMRYTASLNLIQNALRLVLAGCMVVTLHRATSLQWAWATLVVTIAGIAASIGIVHYKFGAPRFSLKHWRDTLVEGAGFSFSGSTSAVYNDVDKAMLSHYGMNAANGLYSVAYRVVNIAAAPVLAIYSAAYPTFFRKGVGGIRSTASYGVTTLKHALIITAPICAAAFLLAPLLPRSAGPGFKEAGVALQWLCLIPMFRCCHIAAGYAMTASGFQRFRTGSQLAAASFNFLVNLYLIPRYSWRGAAWSSLATDGGLAVSNWLIVLWLLRASRKKEERLTSSGVTNNI